MKIKSWIKEHRLVLALSILIITFCAFLGLFLFQESDYFWHLKAGEYMVQNHSVLTQDIFSWIIPGKYWMSHEWLFEVLIYGMKSLFSNYSMFLYIFLSILSLQLFLFFTNRKGYQKNIPFTLFWIICFLLFCGFLSCRPHLLSYILLALTIWLLRDLFFHENSKKIYFLPVISILWANFHGGSSNLTYLLCFIFIIVGLFQFQFSKIEAKRLKKKQLLRYGLVAILSITCLCINPHGIKILMYPYENLANDFMQFAIVEWHPTDLSNFGHYPYLFFLGMIVLILLFSKNKIRLLDLILFGIGLFLGLKSIRFWPYIYILSSFFIFDYIKERKKDPGTIIVISSLALIFGLLFTTHFGIPKEEKIVPDSIIETIQQVQPKRLYNYYDYGGYLIAKEIPVFIDGRADLYSPYNYKDYYSISVLSGDYVKMIEKYQFDYFLVPTKSSIATYLKYSSEYKAVISENGVILYKKGKL